MPIAAPALDARRYQDLLDEALARVPVHTPEWTNFNPSDPGVTLIEVFAFLTESLLYRTNQVPERNQQKFLQLLGLPLRPAASARGLVSFAKEGDALTAPLVDAGTEVLAGDVPFRTDRGLDVLPVEARVYYKRRFDDPDGTVGRHYNLLYASLKEEAPDAETELALYQTVEFAGGEGRTLALGEETVDGCVWVALLARASDAQAAADKPALRERVRAAIAGRTLSMGIVPALAADERAQPPASAEASRELLQFWLPDGTTTAAPGAMANPREAAYRLLEPRGGTDVLHEPGVVELVLPASAERLRLWDDLDPLEAGSGAFPPALDDPALDARVVTWIRVSQASSRARLQWIGINAVPVTQRNHVASEMLEPGNGEPDQARGLAHRPVLRDSVQVHVEEAGAWKEWRRIDDLACAGPEVAVADPRLPPGTPLPRPRNVEVFAVDPEAGQVAFGDGLRGRRPPAGARIRVRYDHSKGPAGNVPAGAINTGSLPDGCKVANPVRTWGGVAAETVDEGRKQVPRYLQHRDRLVTVPDFEAIARRTPGVEIGRVDVLPAFSPDLLPDAEGNAPGAVTLMVVPRHDARHPDWPEPDRLFINAVCRHLDPRRLVTTELILRGPVYRSIWVTCGIEVTAGNVSVAEIREEVKRRLLRFLSPLGETGLPDADDDALQAPRVAQSRKGWALRKAVSALELMAEASRVPGVRLVSGVRLADGEGRERGEIPMQGLELPRVAGIAVQIGDAPAPADLATRTSPAPQDGPPRRIVAVPVIPPEC